MRFHPILDKKCNLWKSRKCFFAHKESDKGQVKGGIQMAKRRMSLETRQKKRQRSIEQERIMLAIIAIFMVIFLIWLFLF